LAYKSARFRAQAFQFGALTCRRISHKHFIALPSRFRKGSTNVIKKLSIPLALVMCFGSLVFAQNSNMSNDNMSNGNMSNGNMSNGNMGTRTRKNKKPKTKKPKKMKGNMNGNMSGNANR